MPELNGIWLSSDGVYTKPGFHQIQSHNTDNITIKTHGKSRGQEEAGLRDERVSYLQVVPL